MEYAIEMGSDGMMYMPSFMTIGKDKDIPVTSHGGP
jgi:hypothetical protein